MLRIHRAAMAFMAFALALPACTESSARAEDIPAGASIEENASPIFRRYGAAVKVGNGFARAYIEYDREAGNVPIELGVALDESAMDGLPARNPHAQAKDPSGHEHVDNHVFILSLPADGAPPYEFVELDWNPGGHEPPGVYDEPHFDFHFYVVPQSVRESIVPSDPDYQLKADMLPPESHRPEFYAVAAPPGAPAPGVPLMGVHWIDVRSPELQKAFGKPEAWQPFSTTFIYGSWEGRFHFIEPMITRSFIMSKKGAADPEMANEVIPVSMPKVVGKPGYYPSAYRVAWDKDENVYRVGLTNLERRN